MAVPFPHAGLLLASISMITSPLPDFPLPKSSRSLFQWLGSR